MKKRLLSIFLVCCMVFGLIPTTVLAANSDIPFEDVKTTDWFYDGACYAYENGLMQGTSSTTFNPNGITSRGMIVTILYRLEGEPTLMSGNIFTDVSSGDWYEKAVVWANGKGIVTGYGNGKFGPNDPITREQLAAIMYRYADYKAYDTSARADLSKFSDSGKVSSYASDALSWANATGLITGINGAMLNPQGEAVRAQAAVILMRFCKEIAAEKTYTVTFDLNYGNAGIYKTQEVKVGNKVTPPEKPTRKGYTFVGWYVNESGGRKYDFDEEVSSDLMLYAHWNSKGSGGGGYTPAPTETYYTVTFDSNGGSAVESQQVKAGECAVEPSEPTKDGYTFGDWYSDSGLTSAYSFETPITKDITVYAKWNDAANKFSLSSSCTSVLIGTTNEVLFYLETDVAAEEIALMEVSSTEKTVATMYDDGNFAAHGDDIAGDGVYSAIVSNPVSEDDTLTFQAKYNGNSSNEIDIDYYLPLSQDALDRIEAVDTQIDDLLTDAGFQEKTIEDRKLAANELLDEIVSSNLIEEASITYDEDSQVISFTYADGICGGIMLGDFDEGFDGIDTRDEGMLNDIPLTFAANLQASLNESLVGTALILNAFPAFETKQEDIEFRTVFYENLRDEWNSNGLSTTLDTDVTVSDYQTKIDDYDVICISTHGSTYSWNDGFLWLSHHQYPAICLAEKSTKAKDKNYELLLKDKQIVKVNGCYWILPAFFENTYNSDSLGGEFIFIQCCQNMGKDGNIDYSMANAFLSRSATSVVGFHNSVYSEYGRGVMRAYVNALVAGKSATEAFNTAREEMGITHKVWYENIAGAGTYDNADPIAYPILSGDSEATLVQTGIANGNFEFYNAASSTPTKWSFEGDVRSLIQLGDVKPYGTSSKRMAIITTGVGSKTTATLGAGTEGSRIYQKFVVPEGKTTLTFDYNFVSEEPMEFVGSQYDDTFAVQISKGGTIVYNNSYESINTSTWVDVGNIDFDGGDSTVFQTGWKTATIDVSAYQGQVITLYFIVYDMGDSIYDSACVIDNVSLN